MNVKSQPSVISKTLTAYKQWHRITHKIPKMRRYSLGVKIDNLFTEILELISMAQFSPKEEKENFLSKAVTKNDVLKFMLYILFELDGIEEKHFMDLGEKMEEVGRILYGWKNQIIKQTGKNKKKN